VNDEGGTAPLWHGRFDTGPAAALWDYSVSLAFDRRLAPYDIIGSRAHAAGLARGGIITQEDAASISSALDICEGEMSRGSFIYVETDEDIHTAIERRVTELAGPAGARLHTARSRNDQVATAFRLFTKTAIAQIAQRVLDLQDVLLERAQEAGTAPDAPYLPGYTHLQQAQPVLLAHHLAAHAWALSRDVDRLCDAYRRCDVSPLGAGAIAGTSLPIDPSGTAAAMGFARVFENSLDATSDRDFAVETLFDLTVIGVHLSRMGEEVVIWSTEEFGFLRLDDAYATGSSMLPQKKNPDVAELARGRSGRLIGNLAGLLATLKGLPLAYNRDLQEDKEPLFDAVDQIGLALRAMTGLYSTATFRTDVMRERADQPTSCATDLAEFLVRGGTPFRDAHAIVGRIVRRHLDDGIDLEDLVRTEPRLGPEAVHLLAPGVSVAQRTSHGGAGHAPVAEQLVRLEERITTDRSRIRALR